MIRQQILGDLRNMFVSFFSRLCTLYLLYVMISIVVFNANFGIPNYANILIQNGIKI